MQRKSVLATVVDSGATSKWKGRQLLEHAQPNLPTLLPTERGPYDNQQTLCQEQPGRQDFTAGDLVLLCLPQLYAQQQPAVNLESPNWDGEQGPQGERIWDFIGFNLIKQLKKRKKAPKKAVKNGEKHQRKIYNTSERQTGTHSNGSQTEERYIGMKEKEISPKKTLKSGQNTYIPKRS